MCKQDLQQAGKQNLHKNAFRLFVVLFFVCLFDVYLMCLFDDVYLMCFTIVWKWILTPIFYITAKLQIILLLQC